MIPARRPGDPRADALRVRFHGLFTADEIPVPIAAIAEDLLGLLVEEASLAVSGMLVPRERRIVLNADEPPERRRFTLAHEIGHWVCQCVGRPLAAPVLCRTVGPPGPSSLALEGVDAAEREANVFAAELLMPAEAVRALAPRAAPVELVRRFAVSEPAIAWRLFNLGLAARPPPA